MQSLCLRLAACLKSFTCQNACATFQCDLYNTPCMHPARTCALIHTEDNQIFTSSTEHVQHLRTANMHLPTYATSPQAPTSLSQYLTTPDTSSTLNGQDQPNPLSIFTPTFTDDTANVQTSRRIVWQTPNVVMDDIPTTLVTVTTTAHATRWITLPAESTATATDSLLASLTATATHHAATTPAAKLADVGEGIPDWPPLLIIFLLCWLTVAWVVAAVLYLATFPEKIACLDGVVGRWMVRGQGDRYVRFEDV